MKLRFPVVLLLAIAMLSIHAQGQGALYVNPIGIRVSNSQPDYGTFAYLGQGNTSLMFAGINIGGGYDFSTKTTLKVGLDARDSILHRNNALLDNILFGVRISGQPFKRPFKPYVEPAIGFGRTRSPVNMAHKTNVEYALFGGVDYALAKHVDFRVVEVGYGSLATINSSDFSGGTTNYSSSTLLTVSTGLVFHF